MKKIYSTNNKIKNGLSITALAAFVNIACLNAASAAPITLVNQGFETGDLSGWNTIGEVNAVGQTTVITNNGTNYSIDPHETTMAFLDSFGSTVGEIETFFGINSGSLFNAHTTGPTTNAEGGIEGGEFEGGEFEGVSLVVAENGSEGNGNYNLTNGSAISQSFTASAGDTISMSWNYAARDYIPFTDPSFAVLVAPDGTAIVDVLASTTGPGLATGSDGISGVFNFAQELTQDGKYTLGFAVTNSQDTALNATLFLDDAAGSCEPQCSDLGLSPGNPLLPEEDDLDDNPESFDFSFTVEEPSTPIFIDPIVAVGYDYVVDSGPNVASVILPDVGDGQYKIYGWDGVDFNIFLGDAFANIEFDFAAGGVSEFQVLDIETSALLDPTDDLAFITGLTFVSSGQVVMSQTPVTFDTDSVTSVPEPSSLSLFGLGFIGAYYLRRKRSQFKNTL